MRKKEKNILWIDWGSKYIGLAYVNVWWWKIIMPIGYLLNDGSLMYNLGDIILRYNIGKIVVGYPSDENLQKKVDEFIKQLNFIIAEDISIEKVNEDYTSVQAGVLKWNFEKDQMEDSLAAMKILEYYLEHN